MKIMDELRKQAYEAKFTQMLQDFEEVTGCRINFITITRLPKVSSMSDNKIHHIVFETEIIVAK